MKETLRHIVHIDLDSFFVSVERLNNPALCGKPVLIGGPSDRGVVASCSYEARKFGIHSAMPMRTARRLCPHAIIISGNYDAYSQASRFVTQIIHDHVPLYEKTSIDEFYIDLTGMDKFFGCYQLATELRQTIILKTGLPISFGLSANKTVSKIATGQAKPNGQLYVPHGTEKDFLAPLPVSKIPMIGRKAHKTLLSMGIYKIRDLQRQSPFNLERIFGKPGALMWNKANGIDYAIVQPSAGRKSISSEHTFHEDTLDTKLMEQLLISMCEQLTHRLRKEDKTAACLAIKIRYSNFETFNQQISIHPSHADHILFPQLKTLFAKALQPERPVRLIGVRLSNLSESAYQISLFDNSDKTIPLYETLDRLNTRFGSKTVSRAVTIGIRPRHFNPFNGNTPD